MEISKADWKLFRERLPEWQESYMERLILDYIEQLNSKMPASEKFWAMEERIRQDKRKPGVLLELKKSEVCWDLIWLINDGVITVKDLDGFSENLKDTVLHLLKTQDYD